MSVSPRVSALQTFSVLTCAHVNGSQYLPELYSTIRQQSLPPGWVLEWVVWEDGVDPRLASFVAELVGKDPRVRYGSNGTQNGPAVTRTQAFHASSGSLILAVDQDDFLEPGCLGAIIEAFSEDGDLAYVAGSTYEIDETGAKSPRERNLPPGRVPAGLTLELWNKEGLSTPWYPTATAFRRDVVTFFGGWPANVAAEDTELLACVSAAFDGVLIEAATVCRRNWSGQFTRTPPFLPAASSARIARHRRATLIDGWRRSGRL